jgi:hypothetical protein
VVVSSETIWPMAERNLPHHYFFKFFTRTVDAFLPFPNWCRPWFPSTDGAPSAASILPSILPFNSSIRHQGRTPLIFWCYVWRGLVEVVLGGFESDSPVIYGMECTDSMIIGTMFWNFEVLLNWRKLNQLRKIIMGKFCLTRLILFVSLLFYLS